MRITAIKNHKIQLLCK